VKSFGRWSPANSALFPLRCPSACGASR
jgi:hypothetical protein